MIIINRKIEYRDAPIIRIILYIGNKHIHMSLFTECGECFLYLGFMKHWARFSNGRFIKGKRKYE